MGRNVALIGAGAMGSAIGTRLCETGHNLIVFDLDAEKVAALVDKGATGAKPATLIINMSSIDPETTRQLASKAKENKDQPS